MTGGLFQRLSARASGDFGVNQQESILKHLAVLLNTRQGSSALDPEYGMPDMTDVVHNIPAGIPALSRMIAETIQRYEPRLKSVTVRASPPSGATLSLSFEVRAQLVRGGTLRFETRVTHGGHVTVS